MCFLVLKCSKMDPKLWKLIINLKGGYFCKPSFNYFFMCFAPQSSQLLFSQLWWYQSCQTVFSSWRTCQMRPQSWCCLCCLTSTVNFFYQSLLMSYKNAVVSVTSGILPLHFIGSIHSFQQLLLKFTVAAKSLLENRIEFLNVLLFQFLFHSQVQPANAQNISFEIFLCFPSPPRWLHNFFSK